MFSGGRTDFLSFHERRCPMTSSKLEALLKDRYRQLKEKGILKGAETVITGVKTASGKRGPRYFIEGYGDKEFIRMNSNSYLGMSLRPEVIEAEENAARRYGAGPGAVRFISGTYEVHVELEKRLASFHRREAAMIMSSAYATVVGTITPLIDEDTVVISDELNHNCIINAVRLARPKVREVYRHRDMNDLERVIGESVGRGKRVLVVTDGIFSMRGVSAPLGDIEKIADTYDSAFEQGIVTVVDDSHGIGAFGSTGRGTEEHTGARVDILIATLGKALGVNGGYVCAVRTIIDYLRETAPFYIYSNPITPSEACAAMAALDILDSDKGRRLLGNLRSLTRRFERGLIDLGYEIIESEHPIVPIMIRDTKKTADLVEFLKNKGVLTTGLNYPVVPKGDEEIRCQIAADHTEHDIDYVLDVLRSFKMAV
jgi:glycine C-acetyltransferase